MFKKPIQSPYQAITQIHERDLMMAKTMGELLRIHNTFVSKLEEVNNLIDKKVGPKGEKGDKGDRGDTPELNYEYIISELYKIIPRPKDGKDGQNIDYKTTVSDILNILKPHLNVETIAQKTLSLVEAKSIKDSKKVDHKKIADLVIEKIRKDKLLKTEHIGNFTDGLEQTIRPIRSLMAGFRGGGDVVTAGSNITITTNADGKKVITSTGGSGFTALAATETPDGIITVFTFSGASAQPTYLVVDNVWMKATTAKGTVNWTWNNVTKKATLSIPAVDDIWGVV